MFDKDYDKLKNSIMNNQYRCVCGHNVYISKNEDKHLCCYCGRYVYKSENNNIMYISLVNKLKNAHRRYNKKIERSVKNA